MLDNRREHDAPTEDRREARIARKRRDVAAARGRRGEPMSALQRLTLALNADRIIRRR